MASNSFKVKNSLVLTPKDLSTLTSPEAGDLACDINDSNKIKRYDANAAAWVEVGSGGGVGGVDIFFVQDFESASLSSFTQTGLVLSQTDPLKGRVSAVLNHQAGVSPTNDQSFKQIIPVDRKFRGQTMVLRLDSKSNASQGNLVINIKDETNNANLVASEQLQLSDDINGKKTSVSFTIPENCSSVSYTITALPESGKVSRIDDIICELAETALLETAVVVPNVTAWQGYTPTFQGFGSPTNIEFEWRQVGENVEIRGKFTSGTSTAVEARIRLPGGLTSAGTSLIPSLQQIGAGNYTTTSPSTVAVLIEPSVTYLTFGAQSNVSAGISKVTGSALLNTGNILSFFASVPCAGLSATTTKTIPLTQSGLVQEADSVLEMSGSSTIAAAATYTWSTTTFSKGSAISYDNATGRFTVSSTGVYDVTAWITPSSASGVLPQIIKNSNQQLVARHASLASAGGMVSVSANMYLNAGDYFFLNNDNSLGGGAARQISITYQGSLKQVSVSSDQKITIPTSELRFEGASSFGAVATRIVKFDTLAKIRGDAFTVTNTANDGTAITMTKAGRLTVTANLRITTNTLLQITRNQATLTSITSTASELLAQANPDATTTYESCSWTGDVNVGDIIRISAGAAPTADGTNNLSFAFQEQSVQVSVSNTLPQFSESDSSVRLDTANGYGSTANVIRRFSNVRENIGTAIEYVDSATNGASFIIKESGVYNISYSECFTAASDFGITKNATVLTTSMSSTPVANKLAQSVTASANFNSSCSWEGYLVAGDIIRPHTDGAVSAAPADGSILFTISKVGKPNVTGVDVTPFVNIPQNEIQKVEYWNGVSATSTTSITSLSAYEKSVGQVITDPVITSGDIYIYAREVCDVSVYVQIQDTNNLSAIYIYKNGNLLTNASSSINGNMTNIGGGSATARLNVGDFIRIDRGNANVSYNLYWGIQARSVPRQVDSILTAPETFSTDTASLTYAPSSVYTLSTLANAPVGTFITFTYAANTNTRTQTVNTAPTQFASGSGDANTNGIQIFTRAYNATSSAAQPAAIAIQIGKGLKGITLNIYRSAGKGSAGSLDYFQYNSAGDRGVTLKNYNESTGIIIIDAGLKTLATTTSSDIQYDDGSTQTSGYLVINASKNPALTGLGLNRVAARAVQSSGQSFATGAINTILWDSAKVFDTTGSMNTATGIYTAPEVGYYQIVCQYTVAEATVSTHSLLLYKNGVLFNQNNLVIPSATNATYTQVLSDTLFLNKGDTVELRFSQNSGTTRSAAAGANFNILNITKVSV